MGDRLKEALSSVGVTPEKVTALLGRPCGCAERQERLNQLDAWARQQLKSGIANTRKILAGILGKKEEDLS